MSLQNRDMASQRGAYLVDLLHLAILHVKNMTHKQPHKGYKASFPLIAKPTHKLAVSACI